MKGLFSLMVRDGEREEREKGERDGMRKVGRKRGNREGRWDGVREERGRREGGIKDSGRK